MENTSELASSALLSFFKQDAPDMHTAALMWVC